LSQFPIRRKPKIKFEENASPVFKIRRKTEDGWIEEIPAVAPTFKVHHDVFKDDEISQKKGEISKKQKNFRKKPSFFRFFVQSLTDKREDPGFDVRRDGRLGLSESFKEFNKVLSESVLKYNQSFMQGDRDSSKGFVPVKVCHEEHEDVISYANPHKKIEVLEDLLKKCKNKDSQMKEELRIQLERNSSLKGVLKRLDRLYKLKLGKLRKRIKIEDDTKIESE
jgi:small nuclear ribonucleoprotein (snRNP)-like protein